MHKEHHGFLYGILAAVGSAAMAVCIKLAKDIPAETIVFIRFAMGIPFIWTYCLSQGISFTFRGIPKHLLRCLVGFVSIYCYVYCVKLIPLVNAVTLSNTAPLFMPFVVMIWLHLFVSKWRYIAAGIGFLGVVILLRPDEIFQEVGSLFGITTGLLSAIALLGVRQLSKTESAEKILLYYFTISSVLSFYPMVVTWKSIPNLREWGYLILIGIFSVLYQYLITKSYTHTPATKASLLNYLAVVFGGLGGWLIFNEIPDVWVWIGTVLIVVGACVALFDKTQPRPFGKSGG